MFKYHKALGNDHRLLAFTQAFLFPFENLIALAASSLHDQNHIMSFVFVPGYSSANSCFKLLSVWSRWDAWFLS